MDEWAFPDWPALIKPAYTWQPRLAIERVPGRFRDLISSEEKLYIFELIHYWQGTFTASEILLQSEKSQIDVSLSTIQFILKALCYRGFLAQFDRKIGATRGRSTAHYRKVNT